jgi:hypothetical protein
LADDSHEDTLAKIFEIGRYASPKYRNDNSLPTPRAHCRCAAALDRQNSIQREIRDLKNTRPGAQVLSLEDFLGDPANPRRFWDLIYSASLLTAVPDLAAKQIIRAAAYRLKPGGYLLLANPILDSRLRLCDTCRDAGTIYRTESELAGLTQELSIDHFSDQIIFRGASENNVYLELYRLPQTEKAFCARSAA